jgi:hypothetical protein
MRALRNRPASASWADAANDDVLNSGSADIEG